MGLIIPGNSKRSGSDDWTEIQGLPLVVITSTVDGTQIGGKLRCRVLANDDAGRMGQAISNETNAIIQTQAPVIQEADFIEQNPGSPPRFEDQKFIGTVIMEKDGAPMSVKQISAYVDGTFTTERQFNELLQSQSEIGITKTWSNTCTSPGGYQGRAFDGNTDARGSIRYDLDLICLRWYCAMGHFYIPINR